MWACVLDVKIEKDSSWCRGIGIGREPGTATFDVICVNGKVYDEVWDYRMEPHYGSFVIHDPTK